MKVYLSGGFYKEYKDEIVPKLTEAGLEVFDPETKDEPHHIPGYFVGMDFDEIRDSDIVLAYRDEYPYVYGMAAEVGYAVAMNKIVVYVDTNERVDTFLSACAKATFTDFGSAVRFIVERYGNEQPEPTIIGTEPGILPWNIKITPALWPKMAEGPTSPHITYSYAPMPGDDDIPPE